MLEDKGNIRGSKTLLKELIDYYVMSKEYDGKFAKDPHINSVEIMMILDDFGVFKGMKKAGEKWNWED